MACINTLNNKTKKIFKCYTVKTTGSKFDPKKGHF